MPTVNELHPLSICPRIGRSILELGLQEVLSLLHQQFVP